MLRGYTKAYILFITRNISTTNVASKQVNDYGDKIKKLLSNDVGIAASHLKVIQAKSTELI